METSGFDLFALLTLLILAVAMPLIGIWDYRRLLRWTEEGRTDARTRTFQWIIGLEWSLTVVFIGAWLALGREIDSLGLAVGYEGWQWLPAGLSAVLVIALVWQMISVLSDPAKQEEVRGKMGDLVALAPQTSAENAWFNVVAVTAGVCEEIVYRGILLATLEPVTGIWPAVALTSVIFGLGHLYQGMAGVVKTTLIGVIMALLTVFSGSLLAAIVVHAVIDLTSGRMMGRATQEQPVSA